MSDPIAPDAIILVGGKGTRLQPVVKDRPKPMAEVLGRPFLEWLLMGLRSQGIRRVVLATGYRAEVIQHHFTGPLPLGLELVFSQELVPLGTGGALRNTLGQLSTDRVLVLNGDSTCSFDLPTMMEAHLRAGALATLWLVPMEDCSRYGSVELDGEGRVSGFREKSSLPSSGLINAGIYLLEERLLQMIPPGQATSLERDVFPSLIGRGMSAVVGQGPFLDIGTPETYAMADRFLAENRLEMAPSGPEGKNKPAESQAERKVACGVVSR
ncbi:MAG: nucleotidyltransferase family protein [Chloroflexi bacterium]|nr:nucleotidyltransferase family protein [Chloroflexota bacterium]